MIQQIPCRVRVTAGEVPRDCLVELAIAWRSSGFTDPFFSVFYFIDLDLNRFVGVFGDGDNAVYEWFIWNQSADRKGLQFSQQQYGAPACALRDGLITGLQ